MTFRRSRSSTKSIRPGQRKEAIPKAKRERRCKRCGCTQNNACEDLRLMDSCCWVTEDLCSACLTDAEFRAWTAANKRLLYKLLGA